MAEIIDILKLSAAKVDKRLDEVLSFNDELVTEVIEASRYAALGQGKRLRPFLLLEWFKLLNTGSNKELSKVALDVAVAIECIHCYSLIHDDLPAMDDDDIRRGKPTVHRAFSEATAILAGDALLTYAFELISSENLQIADSIKLQLINMLAKAAGINGMIAGQCLDLLATNSNHRDSDIILIQKLKTGCLFEFSCLSGAVLANASDIDKEIAIEYARNIGLAFQIVDDLLDINGCEQTVGKRLNKDEIAGKATFVAQFGYELAKEKANLLINQAIDSLNKFGNKAYSLKKIAEFIIIRNS